MPDLYFSPSHMPSPAGLVERAESSPHAARLASQYQTLYGAHRRDGDGDTEDYWEAAARLDAVLVSGAERVWCEAKRGLTEPTLLTHGTWSDTATNEPDLIAAVNDGRAAHYGPISRHSHLARYLDCLHLDYYARTRTFVEHAGRDIELVGIDLEDDQIKAGAIELASLMTRWFHSGHTEIVVKAAQSKHGLWRMVLAGDDQTNRSTISRHFGWSAVHLGQRPQGLIAQGVVDMRYEYRVFVVDGVPVTGAGCVEEYTPLEATFTSDGEPVAFSSFVRADRYYNLTQTSEDYESDVSYDEDGDEGPGTDMTPDRFRDPVEDRPDLRDRFVDAAHRIAADFARQDPMPVSYVIDLAVSNTDPDAPPLLIECNAMSNSGLYATHPALVTQALVAAAARVGSAQAQ